MLLENLERRAIIRALAKHHGNRTQAARELGIGIRTVQRRIREWRQQNVLTLRQRRIVAQQGTGRKRKIGG